VARRKRTPDVHIDDCGSFLLIIPETDAGRKWVDEHLVHEETIRFGGGVACEPRYVAEIRGALEGDDLVVSP
jgi:hypothetical protein